MADGRDPYQLVFYPYLTEKTMSMMEKENKLEFVVRRTTCKSELKKALEQILEVKIEKITTRIAKDGKHAIIKLKKEFSASEIGMRMGIL